MWWHDQQSEDQLLREVLAHEAERHGIPGYDPAEVVAGAHARRRRRRALVGGAALALTVVVGSAVLVAQGFARRRRSRDRPAGPAVHLGPEGSSVSAPLVRVPGGRNASALSIPFCEARSDLTRATSSTSTARRTTPTARTPGRTTATSGTTRVAR